MELDLKSYKDFRPFFSPTWTSFFFFFLYANKTKKIRFQILENVFFFRMKGPIEIVSPKALLGDLQSRTSCSLFS